MSPLRFFVANDVRYGQLPAGPTFTPSGVGAKGCNKVRKATNGVRFPSIVFGCQRARGARARRKPGLELVFGGAGIPACHGTRYFAGRTRRFNHR